MSQPRLGPYAPACVLRSFELHCAIAARLSAETDIRYITFKSESGGTAESAKP